MNKVTIEILDDETPAEMEKCVNNEEDAKKEIPEENEDGCVIHRVSTEYASFTNQDTLNKVL